MKVQKTVTVIARYIHKNPETGKPNGTVSYLVRSSDGKSTYCTTIINGKASGCSCPSRSPKGCYHKNQLENKEQQRKEVAQQFSASSVPTWTMQLVTAGKLIAPKQVVKTAQEVVSERATYWDDNRACICYRDTRKPTGSLEGIDFGSTPMRWNAEEECFEEIQRGFTLLKVS